MAKFFDQYADLTAVVLTFLLPFIVTIWIKRKTRKKTRAVGVWLLVFGPICILSFIFFHLFENSYRAVSSAINRNFVYNFHFYSLMLLGIVIGAIGLCFLRSCINKCFHPGTKNTSILFSMLLITIISAPLLPITPLASVPLIGCLFSLPGLTFVIRKQIKPVQISFEPVQV